VVRFDPQNPKVVYSASVVCWKSADGGETWDGWRGAPGGDDYQNVWINPKNPQIILLGSDQGAIITVNGGATWSSWYNQSTAQLYHVSADNAFPYRLYSGQQESGSVGIASRGPNGEITFRDWHPVGAEEYGYVTAAPHDPDIVYGGKLTRYDRRTNQAQSILPKPFRSDEFRMVRTQPVIFSPTNPHLLFFATNTLWQTSAGGRNWQEISQDLTRKTFEIPASVGKFRDRPTAQTRQRGVIYTVAPSPLDGNRIWAGTDDGLIHLTTDAGKNWTDATPPQIGPWWKISLMDASHFEAKSVYAAVNTIRVDDLRPHIYRTVTSAKPGRKSRAGFRATKMSMWCANTQRAGCSRVRNAGIYVSFDDGNNWQSLRLNLPATSVRDLIVKDDDLAIATHGRGFWILDNITSLRQLQPNEQAALLFKPQTALRVRWNSNTDTPLPPDEPAGENPPEGAMIDYSLGENSTGPVTLEIEDRKGEVARRYASTDPVPPEDSKLKIPRHWVRPPRILSNKPGLHLFWDMHGEPLPDTEPEYPMSAVYRETAPQSSAPWVLPGSYSVVLTAGGKSFTQPLTLKMDPRVKASEAELTKQFELSRRLQDLRAKLQPIGKSYEALVGELEKAKERAGNASVNQLIENLRKKLEEFANPSAVRSGESLELDVLNKVKELFGDLQEVDAAPTPQQEIALGNLQRDARSVLERWKTIPKEVAAVNARLEAAGLQPLSSLPE
jgi:hypothetical protein